MLKTKFQFHPIPQNCHFPEIYFPIQLIFFSFKIHKNLIHPSTRVANPPRTHTITRASRTRIVFSSHESAHIFTPFFGWFCCGACVCAFFFARLFYFPSSFTQRRTEPTYSRTHTHTQFGQTGRRLFCIFCCCCVCFLSCAFREWFLFSFARGFASECVACVWVGLGCFP